VFMAFRKAVPVAPAQTSAQRFVSSSASCREDRNSAPAQTPDHNFVAPAIAVNSLQSFTDASTITTAKPFRQRKKSMSRRSGQAGQVFLRNDRWVGRFYVDVLGQTKRVRKAVVLGLKKELTKPEARSKLKAMLSEEGINTPEHLERSLRPSKTFRDVADLWESKRLPQLKESSQCNAPKLIAKHLRPFFGSMALETINTGAINDWIAERQKAGLEPKTVHNMWKLFRAIMNWHSQQNDEQPRKWYPNLPTIPEGEQRWFTQGEVRQLAEAADGQYKLVFHLAGSSGLRAGELFGLHVEDLDLDRGVIRVRRSVWNGREVSTKTKRGYRDVWVDSGTAQMLSQHLGARTAGRVFQSRRGTPLHTGYVLNNVLYPLCDRLSIPRGGLHAFRHGRVSHLQANNVPGDFTKSQVGHSSLRTTSIYTHFSEDFARETVERLASELPSRTHSGGLDSVAVAPN
jgi:integrase